MRFLPCLRILILLLWVVTPFIKINANTIEKCDNLIKEGVNAFFEDKNYVRSLELLTEARIMAETNEWPEQLFLALNNIGLNYYELLDYGEALNNFLEAYKIALRDLEPNSEMIVLNNIAILYSKEEKLDKAEEFFKKAYTIAVENKNDSKIALYALNLGILANQKGNVELSEEYINIALPFLGSHPGDEAMARVTSIKNTAGRGKYEIAEQLALELLPQLAKNSRPKGSLLLALAEINENKNNLRKAIEYAELTLAENINMEFSRDAYRYLSNLYKKSNDPGKAFYYGDLYYEAKDSLTILKNNKLFENSRIKFELQNYQEELARSNERLNEERRIFTIIVAFAALLILFVIWLLRINSVKYKQRKIITELELDKERHERLLLEKQLQEKETLTLLEEEKLKNEIETKNRQLATKALHLSTKSELIENILNSLSNIPEASQNDTLLDQINRLKQELKGNDTEWQNFLTHFEEVNQGFITNLKSKHPDLTVNDIRFLSYVYMNLTTKEIASLLNITHVACQKRKERISSKLNLPEEINLYSYLSETYK